MKIALTSLHFVGLGLYAVSGVLAFLALPQGPYQALYASLAGAASAGAVLCGFQAPRALPTIASDSKELAAIAERRSG